MQHSRTDPLDYEVKEGATVVASMRYLGLGTQIGLKYDAAASTELTYENGGTSPAPASDKYTGLDQFGRLVETIWKNSGGNLVQSSYGRNRTGGVVWRRDDKAHSLSVISQDDYYWYDGLQQVTRHDRGNLTPSSGPPYTGIDATTRQQQEDFTYDETGNWPGYQSSSPALAQTRTHNKGNEITSITNFPSGVVQPVYDGNGNMTTMPKPGNWTVGYTCKWDVWNRLVEVKKGMTVVASYAYDAETRRTKTSAGGTTRNSYYNKQWRAVEERVSGSVRAQYVWHPSDRWTLIRRKRSVSGTLDETRFCLQDYLDPVAIIDSSGTVEERYGYDAFGAARIMEPDFDPQTSSICDWNLLFHGEFLDGETGLYNYGYRFYHSSLGRWISRDPLNEEGGENLYLFSGNQPMDSRDYMGLLWYICWHVCEFSESKRKPNFPRVTFPKQGDPKAEAKGEGETEDQARARAVANNIPNCKKLQAELAKRNHQNKDGELVEYDNMRVRTYCACRNSKDQLA